MNNIATAVSQILAAHRARALPVESPANANGAMGPMVGMFLLTTLGATPAGAADPACAQIVDQACVISTNGGAGAPAPQPNPSGHPGGAGGPGGNGGNITNVTTQGSQIGGIASGATTGLLIWSWGGAGGPAGVGSSQGDPGAALGVGGDGGSISATLDGSWTSLAGTALYVQSEGGAGGRGRDSSASGFSSISPDGANGGNAGNVSVTLARGAQAINAGGGRSGAPAIF
jgi:hypothetical protein